MEYVAKPVLRGEGEALSDAYAQIVHDHFPDLFATMITLIGFMTVDSAQPVYFPLVCERPALAVVFLSFLLLVAVTESVIALAADTEIRMINFAVNLLAVW